MTRVDGVRLGIASNGYAAGDVVNLKIDNGRIVACESAESSAGEESWILPGWIDVQVNDIEWLATGLHDSGTHAQRVREVLEYQVARGVTGVALATLAAPIDEIVAYLEGQKIVLDDARSGEESLDSALIGGLVEGTFMNPLFHGAHNPDWVVPPSVELLEQFLATGAVKLINVAPETAANATEVIRRATEAGVVVGCGHAKPNARRVREAVEAGLRYVIHLGNGPTGSHWKRFDDGGLLEETLRNDDMIATVIVDGWHVHPQLVRDWIARKEIERFVGVSDAGFAKGPPDGPFEVFGIPGEPATDGAYLRVRGAVPPDPLTSDVPALFGAAIGMREVFENLLNLLTVDMAGVYQRLHVARPLEEAIDAASRMCAANPASLVGLEDRGSLAVGERADAVIVSIDGEPGEHEVRVHETILAGHSHPPQR